MRVFSFKFVIYVERSNALVYTLRSVVDLSVHLSGLNVVKNLDDEN